MIVIFVDTNLFLQCKAIKQIDWQSLVTEQDVRLLIPWGVVQEIDKNKKDGNLRRARRSKAALKLFKEIKKTEREGSFVIE